MTSLRHRLVGLGLGTAILAAPMATSICAASSAFAATTSMVTYYSVTNVRSGPSTGYSVAGTLPAGTQVTGTLSGDWLQISTPSQYAGKYISTTVLHTASTTTSSTSTPTSTSTSTSATRWTYYSVTNVRTSASTSSAIATTLSAGTQVTGTISGTWLKITTPSNLAGKYISTTVLTATSPSGSTSTSGTTTSTQVPTTGAYAGGVLGDAYTLYSGYNGIKVYLAQKALGMATTPMSSTMNSTMTSAIMSFQRNHGISATGNLDQQTWNALNTGYPFTIDDWRKSPNTTSTLRTDRVNAMVAYAEAQLGKPYIWGGTGPMGFDCSGLMLQAMRAGGKNPTGVSNFTNIRPASDLSNQMWRDTEFTKGSLSNIQYGDFIYYGNSDGVAHHVAMYVGNNTVINAVGSSVQYSSLSNNFGWGMKLGVNRI